MKRIYSLIIFLLITTIVLAQKPTKIVYNKENSQVVFAVQEIEKSLKTNVNFKATIQFKLEKNSCKTEGYIVKKTKPNEFTVIASDHNGLMYGGLELAELIKLKEDFSKFTEIKDTPYIPKRGIKFNIPLDVRTNSFDDWGDAAQNNIIEMWSFEFWEEFFDSMAKNRYNAINFWNAHPFSSMVKLDDYPDVALQDVCGSTLKPQDPGNNWPTPELASSKIAANLKVLKKMTIEEKIVFWQKVMKHAKNRGIDVYFITWNICLNGAALPGSNEEVGDKLGKYGISNDFRNKTSIDYLRKSVKQFLLNYPDVTGIGVTAGENMRIPMTDDDKEKWLWDTYGLGIMDAKALQPNRTVNFIHRFWWTDMKIVKKYWANYPDPFDMSFKYSKAHMFSAVNPPFANPFIDWMAEEKLKSWWNLRNDDIFIHRWGDSEFVRAFIKNFPIEQTAGFHMGSDGYAWGREFISKNPQSPRELEINKHWYNFMLWGRLGYNPNIPEKRFEQLIGDKFPKSNAKLVKETWAEASKIIPLVTTFHWRDWDFMWQPEACMEIWNDLRSVDAFRTNETMEGSNMLNPRKYVKAVLAKEPITQTTPPDVVKLLNEYAENALKNADELLKNVSSEGLKQTLLDIKSMSYLGNYYANKISAAVQLEFFKNNGELQYKNKSIEFLQKAITDWEQYTNINVNRYERQNFSRLRTFDWEKQLGHVKNEVDVAKAAKTYAEDPYLENRDPWK